MLTTDQVLNQCLDITDPEAPAIRTTGGGGAGGSVAVTSIAAGDNNIGNVDVASLPGGSLAGATAQTADYDTGGGTATTAMLGIALPASGGPVAGGTATNPVRTDPTGTTAQPVTDNGGSLTVDVGTALPAGTNLIGSVTSPTIAGGGGTSAAPTTSSTTIVSADSTREELLIVNTGSVDCYVNHGAAATTSHFLLKAGAALPLSGGLAKRAWNGITASGTAQLHIITGTV